MSVEEDNKAQCIYDDALRSRVLESNTSAWRNERMMDNAEKFKDL